jgi:D-arginine dehydrogenase
MCLRPRSCPDAFGNELGDDGETQVYVSNHRESMAFRCNRRGGDLSGQDFDIAVIGAGMAGASAAAFLSLDKRVVLIEAEAVAGYHTTGRSAAIWVQNYGPPDVRALTRLSRSFYEAPPPGFSAIPLVRRRAILLLASENQLPELETALAAGEGLRRASVREARALVPALRPGYLAGAAMEDDAFDLDVAAIHQGFLRMLHANGGRLVLGGRVRRIEKRGGVWDLETESGTVFGARVIVNAAGAWGDDVASIAGTARLGLRPLRRTAAIIDPSPFDVSGWPMICDVAERWYARPEARTRLMVSPADATPTRPHDVRPEEIDVAIGIDRMQQALDIAVRRVEHSWAGLRTFTPDGSLAFGWDPRVEGFFWCVGQGGYGIQTAPAAGRLVADLVLGRDPGKGAALASLTTPARFSIDR